MITAGMFLIVEVYLTQSGTISTTEHSMYIVSLTITSTVTASFITIQIRKLLLKQVDRSVADFVDGNNGSQNLESLNKRWQTILGIESSSTIIYLATGLITAALVASFSPSTTFREYTFLSALPLGPNRCVEGWLVEKPAHVALLTQITVLLCIQQQLVPH
jgi:hypothetical protein